jgi:hypothetical protein
MIRLILNPSFSEKKLINLTCEELIVKIIFDKLFSSPLDKNELIQEPDKYNFKA